MRYILGIDAGATKTSFVLADKKENILAEADKGSANLHNQTEEEIKKTLTEGFEDVLKTSGAKKDDLQSVCFAGSGIDTEDLKLKAESILKKSLSIKEGVKTLVVNDIKAVLPACSDEKQGIAVIVGTGSNFYGLNKSGDEARAGGLDHMLSDEGSSWWIGKQALLAAVRYGDGRGEQTALKDLVLNRFFIKNTRELANIVYEEDFGKTEVAELSKLVDEAYNQGDEVAKNILKNAAKEISTGINAVAKRLFSKNETFDIVAVGGVFNSPFPFKEEIKNSIENKNANFIVCNNPPVLGALKLARKLL